MIVAYLIVCVGLGVWFGRFTKNTKDFFLGGQRFSWWVGSIACVATLVGSYSFLQYSQNGYNFGFSAVTAYTNDWFVMPLFLLVWLPITYYSKLTSIPEYFERRFDRRTRIAVLLIMLIYLQGYIGINLYSIGVAIHGVLGWDLIFSAAVISVLTGIVIYSGGATSVMMVDLIQAFLLLGAGVLVFVLGIVELGGFSEFWQALPPRHKLPFANFNSPAEFHFIGDFWGDAITGTIAFYFINQSVLMRVLSVKSVRDARRTLLFTVLFLMPLAALAVSGAGWVARALVEKNLLDPSVAADNAKDVFMLVSKHLCRPGVFGFIAVAVLAALMSTLEALINAVSAIAVNDIWKPILRPGRDEAYYLKAAKYVAVLANILGILLIPLFDKFGSIYQALAHFTAIVTPPLVVVIVLGACWSRFTSAAALGTLVIGPLFLVLSLFYPGMISPIAHGEAIAPGAEPWEKHTYMRSLFGLIVCLISGVLITFLSKPKTSLELEGLVASSVESAKRRFKGAEPSEEGVGIVLKAKLLSGEVQPGVARLSPQQMQALSVSPGDLLYVADYRWWLGGLRSIHLKAGEAHEQGEDSVVLCEEDCASSSLLLARPISVQKLL